MPDRNLEVKVKCQMSIFLLQPYNSEHVYFALPSGFSNCKDTQKQYSSEYIQM